MIFIKRFLESLSKIVYHSTTIDKILEILKTNAFYTTTSLGTKSDQFDNAFYYMSFSRIKFGGYARSLPPGIIATIVIDGNKLNQRYKGHSVDYWGQDMRTGMSNDIRLRNDENEERLFTDNFEIPNAISYILEIHINIDVSLKDLSEYVYYDVLMDIINICGVRKIPLFVYDDFSAFTVMNKRKALDFKHDSNNYISALVDIYKNYKRIEDIPTEPYYYEYIMYVLELLKTNPDARIDDDDTVISINSSLHNNKTDPIFRKTISELTQIMKKLKVRNIPDLLRALARELE